MLVEILDEINQQDTPSSFVRHTPEMTIALVQLTMNFYRRNYIEGLFLSSGIFKNADFTMERLLQVVKKLRLEENFNGYILSMVT